MQQDIIRIKKNGKWLNSSTAYMQQGHNQDQGHNESTLRRLKHTFLRKGGGESIGTITKKRFLSLFYSPLQKSVKRIDQKQWFKRIMHLLMPHTTSKRYMIFRRSNDYSGLGTLLI